MRGVASFFCGLAALLAFGSRPALAETRFSVTLGAAAAHEPLTGRLIVIASRRRVAQPYMTIGFNGSPVFGTDVSAWRPGTATVIDGRADSYPVDLARLPAGDYDVQALLIRYTLAHRSDGHDIWVPYAPRRVMTYMMGGNLVSAPARVHIDPATDQNVSLTLTDATPPPAERVETSWIKHVRIRSEILSHFWGMPIYIGASVLLPRGWAEHPDALYPSVYVFGHGDSPFQFTTDPATDTPEEQASARDSNVETGYQFSRSWLSDGFPRMVAITLENPSPYFLESYSLNSANNGPWGDATTKELIPYLEHQFHLIPHAWARVVEGASTGGWEAMALQVHYPELFGGSWVFNPDPIDFSRYQLVNIYEDKNFFEIPTNEWFTAERPFRRSREGQPLWTERQLARLEAVLGSHGRSFYQLGIWQATHGPVGPDGYPVPLFDFHTGVINHDVANYMRDHGYDLSFYVRQNWARLGPALRGHINLISGEQDDFFLNLAVYQFETMIREMGGPDYPIRFVYGRPKKGHNWHHTNWAGVVREMAAHMRQVAPPGTDLASWNY